MKAPQREIEKTIGEVVSIRINESKIQGSTPKDNKPFTQSPATKKLNIDEFRRDRFASNA